MDVAGIPMDVLVGNLDACMRMCYYDLRTSLFNFDAAAYFVAVRNSSLPAADREVRRLLFAGYLATNATDALKANKETIRQLSLHMVNHVLFDIHPVIAWATTVFCMEMWLQMPAVRILTESTTWTRPQMELLKEGIELFESSVDELQLPRLKRWILQGACQYPHRSEASRRNALETATRVIFTDKARYEATYNNDDYPETPSKGKDFWFQRVPPKCLVSLIHDDGLLLIEPGKIALQTSPQRRVDVAAQATAILETKASVLFNTEDSALRVLFGPIRSDGGNVKFTCVGSNQKLCLLPASPRTVISVAVKTIRRPTTVLGPRPLSSTATYGLRTPCIMPQEALVAYLMTRLVTSGISPHVTMLYTHLWLQTLDCMLVMEQADCTLLDALCPDKLTNAARLKTMTLQLLQVMLAAGELGIVHADLKPANIGVLVVAPDSAYTYDLDGVLYTVPTNGVCVALLDFGKVRVGYSARLLFEQFVRVVRAMCEHGGSKDLFDQVLEVATAVQSMAHTPSDMFRRLCSLWGFAGVPQRGAVPTADVFTVRRGDDMFETLNRYVEGYYFLENTAGSGSATAGSGSATAGAGAEAEAADVVVSSVISVRTSDIAKTLPSVLSTTWDITRVEVAGSSGSSKTTTRTRGAARG